MRRILGPIAAIVLFATLASAQTPVFSPPERTSKQPPVKSAGTAKPEAKKPQEQPKPQERTKPPSPLEEQFAKLSSWPSRPAREAAFALSGLGSRSYARLVALLQENDWRLRAAAGFALGEMGDRSAIEPLVKAIEVPSNRAGRKELMEALVKLDPEGSPGVILPFVTNRSAYVRREAAGAVPPRLDERYLPSVLEFTRSRTGEVRRLGLEFLGRIEGTAERDEFYQALADPKATVALQAARHLGLLGRPAVRKRLLDLAGTATLRRGAYAMIALIIDEDASGLSLIPEKGLIRKRCFGLIRGEDSFLRGTAAVVLANLSYRSEDPAIRKLADGYLVPILWNTVAGGIYFSDYDALQDLCFEKMALLSGKDFGRDAARWRRWWQGVEGRFLARRELRSLTARESLLAELHVLQRTPDGELEEWAFRGKDAPARTTVGAPAFVLTEPGATALSELLRKVGLFDERGALGKVGDEPAIQVELRLGTREFHRFHPGAAPEPLRPLLEWMRSKERELSWQRFVPRGTASERGAFLAQQQEFFAKTKDETARRERILQLVLGTYADLDRASRALAVEQLENAPKSWVASHRLRIAKLLESERRLTAEAVALVEMLAKEDDPRIRSLVVDMVAEAPGNRSETVLGSFLRDQPLDAVAQLLRDERPRVRVAAARALGSGKKASDTVATLLIAGLKDYDSLVREACLRSLVLLKDERVLSLLEGVIRGEDEALKIRAVQALGRVGGDDSVARLMEIYRGGESGLRWAALRGLKEARGPKAIGALLGLVRESGAFEIRREALDILVSLGGAGVGERLATTLEKSDDEALQVALIPAVADVLGERSAERIAPFMDVESERLQRIAVLTLGRIGHRPAFPRLLAMMEIVTGDAAAQEVLEVQTFHVADESAPAQRAKNFAKWWERYGELNRREWFLLAAQEAGVALDPDAPWLDPERLGREHAAKLLSFLERGNRSARLHADLCLRKILRFEVGPLDLRSDAEEVRKRVEMMVRRLDQLGR